VEGHATYGRTVSRQAGLATVAVLVTCALAFGAALPIPVSLLSSRLRMVQGRPCIPLADLATALGGQLRVAAPGASSTSPGAYEITPGQIGVLGYDAGAPLPPARRAASADGQLRTLRIAGRQVSSEVIVLGRDPYLFLDQIARLLGGALSFDAARGQWAITPSTTTARAPLVLRKRTSG
jgi:hypothetical protein